MTPSLKLRPNAKARVLQGHPWVFVNEVEAPLPAEHDGNVVECRDRGGRLLGTGIYNSKSQIVWRRLGSGRVELDEAYLRLALERAIKHRTGMGEFKRLVWSESDELPGLVVDQFGDTLVVQIQTLAMDRRGALLGDLLTELTGAKGKLFSSFARQSAEHHGHDPLPEAPTQRQRPSAAGAPVGIRQ